MDGKRRIRLLLVAYGCSPSRGSESQVGWSWLCSLRDRDDVQVTLLTSEGNRDELEGLLGGVETIFVDDHVPRSDRLPSTLGETVRYAAFVRRGERRLRESGENHRFDVAHHVSWSNIRMGSPAFAAGVPVVLGPVGGGQLFPWRFLSSIRPFEAVLEALRNVHVATAVARPAVRRRLSSTDLVVSANAETDRWARRAGAVRVVRMVDLPVEFSATAVPASSPVGGTVKLIWVGRLLARKGIGLAIDAVRIASESVDVEMEIVGDGDDAECVRRAVSEGLPIRWLGWVPHGEVAARIEASDALLFTSLRDTGAPPVSEAMSARRRVICLGHHGSNEYADGGWADTVEPTTPSRTAADLAAAIVRLKADGVAVHLDRARLLDLRMRGLSPAARAEQAVLWYHELLGQVSCDRSRR